MKITPARSFCGRCCLFVMTSIALSPLFGCVSKTEELGDVIERSAESKPPWVKGDFSSEGTAEIFVLHQKSDVTRLELGIKQAQTQGMDGACKSTQARIRSELEATAKKAAVLTPQFETELAKGLARVESEGHCPDIAPKFVYWELLRKDTAEGSLQSYDVYVLLSMKKRQYLDALGAVLDALKVSGVPGAQNVVDLVTDSYSESKSED
jgi:hypothetical protein